MERVELHLEVPVIGILRGIDRLFFPELMLNAFQSGLEAIEVTMNTRDGLEMIAENRPNVPPGKLLGMGTICTLDDAKQAIDAGAMFLVTPNLNLEVIHYATSQKVPVVAGALTPSEIYQAWSHGAAMIKVFPCQVMGGPKYIKELRGPFDSIPLVAVGGVSTDNLKAYFQAGANGVGVSSSLFGKEALALKNIEVISTNVKKFTDCAKLNYVKA